jgi:serine/threonine protein kinase
MSGLMDLVTLDYNSFIGSELGSVTLMKELGRGNKGVVFQGFQTTLKRNVAVKILPKASMASDAESEMFSNEAEIIAGLSHPNIIPIYDMGETDDFHYFVMQLVNGDDLDKHIKKLKKHPVPSKRVHTLSACFDIIIPILEALDYAHYDDVVHCDIKPSNILIESRTKRSYLSDFGIAFNNELTASRSTGIVQGSPVYLAPEQALGKKIDGRADIYAMGMTIIKTLLGTVPRRKEKAEEIVKRKISSPETFLTAKLSDYPSIDTQLESIILKSIEADVNSRFTTALEFRDALIDYRSTNRDLFI